MALRVIQEYLGWALKIIGRAEGESDNFEGESKIFLNHPKEAIQYLHYYILYNTQLAFWAKNIVDNSRLPFEQ